MIVPITSVVISKERLMPNYHVKKMMEVLERQGQIEPLQVYARQDGTFQVFEQDAHGSDIVLAARKLNWDTLLIVEMQKYQD